MEIIDWLYTTIVVAVDIILHLDVHLAGWVTSLGQLTYLLLFAIVFAETGLVFAPFLPGDSLLFAAGAIASLAGTGLDVTALVLLLISAAILGDAVNYSMGRHFGRRIFSSEFPWRPNPEHLVKTEAFYERHGANTIIIARFMPIVRTFAPFVAGIAQMQYRKFFLFNSIGAVLWVCMFTLAGYYFGNIPAVKSNFHIVIFSVIGISILPIVIPLLRQRFGPRRSQIGELDS